MRESYDPKISQQLLADRAGIKRSRLAQYEAGRTEPPLFVVRKIARALGVREADLIEDSPPQPEPRREALPRTKAEPTGRLKIYGAVSAGDGNVANLDAEEMDVPIQFARDDYGALVIEGDSMMPFLHSGDLAIFRDWYQPKVGAVMAACVGDHEWVCKLVVYEEGQYKLRSLNEVYPDIVENYRVNGFLVGIVRDEGPERIIRLNPYGVRPE